MDHVKRGPSVYFQGYAGFQAPSQYNQNRKDTRWGVIPRIDWSICVFDQKWKINALFKIMLKIKNWFQSYALQECDNFIIRWNYKQGWKFNDNRGNLIRIISLIRFSNDLANKNEVCCCRMNESKKWSLLL